MLCTVAHRFGRKLAISTFGLGLAVAGTTPALAVSLPFSANCTNHAAIDVTGQNTGITFRKNPVSRTTLAATATVFSITGLANIVIPAGAGSCFYTVTGNDNYCFQARNSPAILTVDGVEGTNHMGAPACQ